jgi:hypothetical protein
MPNIVAKTFAVATLVLLALPLLLVAARIFKAPLRLWHPILLLIGAILVAQGVDVLVGSETIMALLYYLAGAR